MGIVDWTSISNKDKSNSNGVAYLKLEAGKSYRIRPVGKPYRIFQYFIERNEAQGGGFARAYTEDAENCVVFKKTGEKARERFAVNVIDRSDGKLKVLEGAVTIFKQMAVWSKSTGLDPGTKDGGDFAISVECPGNVKKNTRYNCQFLGPVAFSKEETEMIKKQGLYKLDEIYKPTPQAEIMNKLFGESGNSKNSAKASGSSAVVSGLEETEDLDF
jgi:hypothetical protein